MKIFVTLSLLTLCLHLQAQLQQNLANRYAATIDSNMLRKHVFQLASPAYEGRETGTPGNNKAAEYIAKQFALDGIPPIPGDDNYFQELAFSRINWKTIQLRINGMGKEHLRDFISSAVYTPDTALSLNINSLTFLGYGIDDPAYNDYKGKNVNGKDILIFGGEPRKKNGKSRISGKAELSAWSTDPLMKVAAAKRAGAKSIWIIQNDLKELYENPTSHLISERMMMGSAEKLSAPYLPHAFISTATGDILMGNTKSQLVKLRNKGALSDKTPLVEIPAHIRWKTSKQVSSLTGQNVLGYIEGTDPVLKNQLVIISAHYDHLGKRGEDIYYGADDNASGTSAVLEIAKAMMLAKKNGDGPQRSVLCMLVTGEEKGLLGSQYYTEYPVFPLAETVADVNIDMIGRVDTLHSTNLYTYVIGSDRLSTDLHRINEAMNKEHTHLLLDYTYNADDDPNRFYYRSDHYNFAKHGIPAIFFFSGVHKDYHQHTDTPDKIMFTKASTIAQLAFYTAWELANRKDRIKVDVTGRN